MDDARLKKKGLPGLFIILLAAVVAISAITYLKSQGLILNASGNIAVAVSAAEQSSAEQSSAGQPSAGQSSGIVLDSSERPVICTYKNSIIKCTAESVTSIDTKGKVKWEIRISAADPFIKTSSAGLLVADYGGRYLCVISGGAIKWESMSGESIVNADISDDGSVTVIRRDTSYKSKVFVYDPQGREVYSRSFASIYAVQAVLKRPGRTMVVNGIDPSGLFAASVLSFFDSEGNPSGTLIPGENKVYPFVEVLPDNWLLIGGEDGFKIFDSVNKPIFEKNVEYVLSIAATERKYIFVAINPPVESASGRLLVYNTAGDMISDLKVDGTITGLNAFGDIAAVSTGREVWFITSSGKISGKFTSSSEVTDVWFINRMQAAVVTRNSIELCDVKVGEAFYGF